jgi:uncharacterized protein
MTSDVHPPIDAAAADALSAKAAIAIERLRSAGGVVVALSGGVDSAVLLALAVKAIGAERVVAATGRSASVTLEELEDARSVARALAVRHEVVDTLELTRPGYVANRGDRCYHCRTELFETLRSFAQRNGLPAVAYGAIVDDLSDHRPGMVAASEHGVLAPMVEAGLTKKDVRALAARFGLPVTDKPSSPCMASRIPVGTPVTAPLLARVAAAEAGLKALGFRTLRVRHHGDVARLELDEEGLGRVADRVLARRVVDAVQAAGFRFVALDLEGYRTGSLNEPTAPRLQSIGPRRDRGQ